MCEALIEKDRADGNFPFQQYQYVLLIELNGVLYSLDFG